MVSPLIGATKFLNGVPVVPEVVGGSGREYYTPQDALNGEVSQTFLDTTQVGTTDGEIVTTAAFIPADDFYNGMEVVITDLAAVNGGIAETAEIVDSIAATNTLILDRPFNPGAGVTYAIVDKKKIAMNASFEDSLLAVTSEAEINLGGNVIKQIDVTGTVRVLRVKNGRVRNGISWTPGSVGVLILDNVEVSRREGTEDAVLMNPGVDAHALEMYNSKAYGRVRGTTGRARWILNNVTNPGVINAAGFNNAFSVVDANAAAVTFRNVSLSANRVDGSINLFHAESAGSIVSAAPNFVDMRCFIGGDPTVVADTSAPAKEVTICQMDDTATLAVAILTPSYIESDIIVDSTVNILGARASSGAGTFDFNNDIRCIMSGGECNVIKTQGACSGAKTVTNDGTLNCELNDATDWSGINLFGGFTGTALVDGTGVINIKDAGLVTPFNFGASQAAGAPTGSFTPTTYLFGCDFLDIFHFNTGVAVSVGTWNDSAQHWANELNAYHCTIAGITRNELTLVGTVTGGTWDRSGDDDIGFASPGDAIIRRARNNAGAPGATLTVSGNARFAGGIHVGTQTCTATSATATTVTSGSTVYFGQAYQNFGGFSMICFASIAGAVANCTGSVFYDKDNFYDDGMVGANSVGSVTVPAAFAIRDCLLIGTFTLRVGAGAFAGACSVFTAMTEFGDIVTIDGTNFPSWESEICVFFGQPASLGFVTADPATFFVFANCFFYGTSHLINGSLTLGKPVKISSGLAELSGAATTNERLGKYDSAAALIDLTLVTDNVLCVFQLGGTGAAGQNQRGIVDGWGFVVSDGNVNNQGDALEPEAAGSRVTTATVKRVGYALDAPAFPVAANDRLYARIHVDR